MNKSTQWSLLATFGLLFTTTPISAKVVHLLPKPQSVTLNSSAATFALNRAIKIDASKTFDVARLTEFITSVGGTVDPSASVTIKVTYVTSITGATIVPEEAYTLNITSDAVNITAIDSLGVLRAVQTLNQLAEGWTGTPQLEALSMTDYPKFKIRGYMHDIGRSYMEISELKKEIDLLAKFKINVFHWHLTENQGWRLESKVYPQLNATASYTRYEGKYYTQAEAQEIAKYCEERGVMLLPEIDMPGHSGAFERAMGHVMQTAKGVVEMKALLKEAVGVFPNSPYIHIGGDETAINSYREDNKNFLQIMVAYVKDSLKRKVMTWNPAATGFTVANSGVDMVTSWGGNTGLISSASNIDCRFYYLNHTDVYADLMGIYKSNIYQQAQGDAQNGGALATIWNDRKLATDSDIVKQNNLYAAMLALGERAWFGGGKQYIKVGGTTFRNTTSDEFKEFANWEERFLFHKDLELKGQPIPYVKQSNIRWRITDAFPNGGSATAVLPPDTAGIKDSYVMNGVTYGTGTAIGGAVYLRHTWGTMVPSFYSNPTANTTAYAYTYVYSPVAQTVGAQISFQDYSRSNNDKVPDAGKWDRRGSRIWVNDKEIMPPTWTNAGQAPGLEANMGNENFAARTPTEISLQQGWNKVFMKLPYLSNTDGVTKVKWMFTFVLTDKAGTKAVDGLIYSPNKYMNEAAENLSSAISDAKSTRNKYIKEGVGYYPASLATALDKVIADIEATLTDGTVTDATRATQTTTLQTALSTFVTSLSSAAFNQPKTSNDSKTYFYRINTPNRGGFYPTSSGNNTELVGQTTATTTASQWKFVTRTDGSYDIVNRNDSCYISPASTFNTALKTTKTQPTAGWTIKKSDMVGLVIIVSGSSEMNQTNISNKVYNWGSGTNTSDGGCQYSFSLTDSIVKSGGVDMSALTALIATAKTDLTTYVAKAVPGYYSPALATALQSKITEIEGTLGSATYDQAARDSQTAALQTAIDAYLASYNLTPLASNDQMSYWYSLFTPNRESRYPTGQGAGQSLLGALASAATTTSSNWKFVQRTDNSYDIINRADSTYISPVAENDRALTTVKAQPSAGWLLKKSDAQGCVIIVSGTSQFNQTNNGGQGYNVFNWGSGTNTSDTGCQYAFNFVDSTRNITTAITETRIPSNMQYVGGSILVNGSTSGVVLCTVNGQRIRNFSLEKGIYLVRFNKKTYKFVVE